MAPLSGVTVIEVAQFALVPGAAAILADWGADVVKIEHPARGDAIRGLTTWGIRPGSGGFTFLHEILNRGKRSVGLDLAAPEGRDVLLELVRRADVFLTNFLPPARRRLGIDVADLREVNPAIVYGRGSAYGPLGDEADRGGFDGISYWHRAGLGHALSSDPDDTVASLPGPAFGDSQGAVALACGVLAALFQRARGEPPPVVDTSLLAVGAWAMQASLVGANVAGSGELPRFDGRRVRSPLSHAYRTADRRWIALAVLEGDRYWPDLCRALGIEHAVHDERFATDRARRDNAQACADLLAAAFRTRTLAEWESVLATQEAQWEVVRRVGELNDDAQAWANGYLRRVDYDGGGQLTMVSSPVQFDQGTPPLTPAPELGVHTESILRELGIGWERIAELKERHVVT